MARDRVPVLKRCRSLNLDPIYLGIDKKSKKQNLKANRKMKKLPKKKVSLAKTC